MQMITGLLKETWYLLSEMAHYLLFGFAVAGVLKIMIPSEKIYKHLSGNNLSSVIKAALLGVPLPLCSCGVIPVAAHIRKEGASKSATMSFLISTPTTGVDSIMATYSLLGGLFTVFRILASAFAGIFAGIISNLTDREETAPQSNGNFSCSICGDDTPHNHSVWHKITAMTKYAFHDLIRDIWKWLVIGIIAGGIIAYLVPTHIINQYLGNPFIAYPLMLAIGIPMYVCATGSIPIAAALIMKGMAPGAGMVYLIGGPATNTATIAFVAGKLGKKAVTIYLASISVTSVVFGLILDYIWIQSGRSMDMFHGMEMLPGWVKEGSAVILVVLIIIAALSNKQEELTGMGVTIKVNDMTCNHCVASVSSAIKKIQGVSDVKINLKTKEVEVTGTASKDAIIDAVKKAGYTPESDGNCTKSCCSV